MIFGLDLDVKACMMVLKKVFFTIAFVMVCSTANAKCSFEQNRFSLKNDEVVDKQGRIWSRCPIGQTWQKNKGCVGQMRLMNLEEAKAYASSLKQGWRLPSIEELASLVEKRCQMPELNEKVFGVVQETGEGANFLSDTLYMEGDERMPSLYYTIDFMRGEVDAHTQGFVGAVRLVR